MKYVLFYDSAPDVATEAAVREFAENDPFVRNGVVSSWRVKAWNEALG